MYILIEASVMGKDVELQLICFFSNSNNETTHFRKDVFDDKDLLCWISCSGVLTIININGATKSVHAKN